MYELAKSAREKLKAKARSMAAAPSLAKGQDTTSATWSPAEALNADAKTGARPVGKARLYKKGGKVASGKAAVRADRKPRKSGGRVETEIGIGMSNKDVRAANEKREGIKHVGGFKKGGGVKDAGVKEKKALGDIDPSPKRGAAGHYKKGGRTKKEDGGLLSKHARGEHMGKMGMRGRGAATPAMTSKDLPPELVPPTPAARQSFMSALPAAAQKAVGSFGRKKGGRAKKEGGGFLENIGNALAGRGYVDGSTWMQKEKAVDSDATGSAPVRRSRSSDDTLTPAQAKRELAMGRQNMRTARSRPDTLTSEQAERELEMGRRNMAVKKGGKIKKADGGYTGGSLPDPREGLRSEGARVSEKPSTFSKAQQESYAREEGYSEADRKATRKAGGRTGRATGGPALSMLGLKGAGKKVSKKAGKTDINIVINAGKAPPRPPMDDAMPPDGGPALPPPPMPPTGAGAPPPAAPPMPMPPPGPMAGPGLPLPGRKAGGRITKVASSYKDMEAGAATGEGRLQKTDIAKHHKDAPARKAGGRISNVAKSYKGMTAGAESGEGRLQKTDIAKAKMGRGK